MSYAISITVDPAKVVKAISSRKMRIEIARAVAPVLLRRWRVTAEDNLSKNSAKAYVDAIQVQEVSGVRVILELAGQRANMIEHGVETPIDMRDMLLRPFGLEHRVIPFQHSSPGSKGRRGAPMGSAYEKTLGKQKAEKLGRRIYAEARKLAPDERLLGGLAPKLKPHHKEDIYASMRRTPGAKRGDTEYTTYRTISLNSPAESWIYPTRPGAHIVDKMLEEAREDIRDAVSEVLGGVLVEVQTKKRRYRGSSP